MSYVRVRLAVETAVAAAGLAASVLTLLRADWIEILFGFDPDHHSGSAEWLILGILLAVVAVAFTLARFEWRRLRVTSGSAP